MSPVTLSNGEVILCLSSSMLSGRGEHRTVPSHIPTKINRSGTDPVTTVTILSENCLQLNHLWSIFRVYSHWNMHVLSTPLDIKSWSVLIHSVNIWGYFKLNCQIFGTNCNFISNQSPVQSYQNFMKCLYSYIKNIWVKHKIIIIRYLCRKFKPGIFLPIFENVETLPWIVQHKL